MNNKLGNLNENNDESKVFQNGNLETNNKIIFTPNVMHNLEIDAD